MQLGPQDVGQSAEPACPGGVPHFVFSFQIDLKQLEEGIRKQANTSAV